jgi:type VI secretion system protein ImpJ
MFIEPQHFQQMEGYLKAQWQASLVTMQANTYGLLSCIWQESLLATKKLALSEVSAIFQDGYFVSTRDGDLLPEPLDISDHYKNTWIYLGLPIVSPSKKNITTAEEGAFARFTMTTQMTTDLTSNSLRSNEIVIGSVKPKFMLAEHPQYLCLKIAKILEVSTAGKIIFDDQAMPDWLNVNNNGLVRSFYEELSHLLNHRINYLKAGIRNQYTYHLQSISDLVALNTLAKYQVRFNQLSQREVLHPEILYAALSECCAELTSSSDGNHSIHAYKHLEQSQILDLMHHLRAMLTQTQLQKLQALELKSYELNSKQATIPDQDLIASGRFILAVHGAHPDAELKEKMSLLKVATPNRIKDLIQLQLPGFNLRPLAHAPEPMPYYRDYLYFDIEIDPQAKSALSQSSSLIIHIPFAIDDIKMQLWAIRDAGELQ